MKLILRTFLVLTFFLPAYAEELKLSALDKYIRDSMRMWNIPGAAVGVVKDGKIVFLKGYGVRAKGKPDTVTPHTVFRIGSVSKPIAASLVGTFIADGTLTWNDKVTHHLPELKKESSHLAEVSLKHLLSHSTGFPRHTYTEMLDKAVPFKQILEKLDKVKPSCKPGQCHGYQNVLYSLSGYLCEKLTGKTYSALLRERIFKPLGMNSASSSCKAFERESNTALPHKKNGAGFKLINANCRYYDVGPAAGINASAADMAKWLKEILADQPQQLNKNIIEEMTKAHITSPGVVSRFRRYFGKHHIKSAKYGLGWRVLDYSGTPVIYHGGMLQGYSATIAIFPEQGVGIVVLTNCTLPFFPNTVMTRFADTLLGLPTINYNRFRLERKKAEAAARKKRKKRRRRKKKKK